MAGMRPRTTRAALVAISLCAAAPFLGCTNTNEASAPVRPAPAYAYPITPQTIERQMRAIPPERPAARSVAGSEGLRATEDLLVQRREAYGYAVRREPIPWPAPTSSAGWSNIIAEIPGHDAPDEVILVCAHFDAVPGSPGADDNASGTAGVLELARRLSAPDVADRAGRTIRFALFNLEEIGLIGSREHARLAAERARRGEERIVGVINLEMIGYFTDEPNSQRSPIPAIPGVFSPPTVGDSIVIVANQASSAFARELDARMREDQPSLKTLVVDFIPGAGRAVPDVRRSDHAPFWDIDVPAVMVTDTSEFRNPHYHKATDTIETLDLVRMAQVVRALEHAIRSMSARESGSSERKGTPS